MTSQERAEILVTARLLRAVEKIYWLAAGLTIVAALSIVWGSISRTRAIPAIILGLVAIFYCVRIGFDARLLEDVGMDKLTTSELDGALGAVANADKSGRSWGDRCRGARRLVMFCTAATIGQAAVILLAWP